MIDTVQAILLFVIVLLTIILIVLGVQVFLILKDVRTSLKKVNRLLDDAESITESISEPITFISGILSGTKSFSSIAKLFSLFTDKNKEKKE